jgi:hypothetical protein
MKQGQQQQGKQLRAPGVKRLLVISSAVAYVVLLGEIQLAPVCMTIPRQHHGIPGEGGVKELLKQVGSLGLTQPQHQPTKQ